jgi:hypothetical protein
VPRKSATELALNAVIPLRIGKYPETPTDMPTRQQELWRSIVASKPADWFDAATLPILRALVGHIETLEQVETMFAAPMSLSNLEALDKLSRLRDRESKAMAALSTKLRLTIQSRYTPQHAATAARGRGTRKPWEIVDGGKHDHP